MTRESRGVTKRLASIGSNACIRKLVEDVEKLYDQVPVGTPILIHLTAGGSVRRYGPISS